MLGPAVDARKAERSTGMKAGRWHGTRDDWRWGWRSSLLDEGLRSLRRGELGGSKLATLLNASGHSITEGGGEVGSKRPALGVLRQDWGGLVVTLGEDRKPGPGGGGDDRGGLIGRGGEPGPDGH